MELDRLSKWFHRFGEAECKGSCSLYELLSYQIAADKQLLELAIHARDGQPAPNLLFGAVQYVLQQHPDHLLSQYYGSFVDEPRDPADAFPHFKAFCITYEKEITRLLETKIVQTNEVRRCTYLYPIFTYIYERTKQPLALIEIGTSAGLQLFWDQYSYTYGDGQVYGNKDSSLLISSQVRGDKLPLQSTLPPVSHRIGIDLQINDLTIEENRSWLKALIWPCHQERREMFDRAARIVEQQSPTLIEGNGVERVPHIAEQIPEKSVLCIFHTHVANQMSDKDKNDLLLTVESLGSKRNVAHIYNNMFDSELHVDTFIDQNKQSYTIGKTDGHGRWFEWNLPTH